MRQLKHGTVELILGNIVDQDTDAIVNAANTKLAGGGGVDGAIHHTAGPRLMELCLAIPADEDGCRCPTGHVRTTDAGDLNARFVIHAVGPFYDERYAEKAADQLRQVHQLALADAVQRNCRSIAFPAISTGAYRFPIADAAAIAVDVACSHLESDSPIELIRFVLFRQSQLSAFESALESWGPQA